MSTFGQKRYIGLLGLAMIAASIIVRVVQISEDGLTGYIPISSLGDIFPVPFNVFLIALVGIILLVVQEFSNRAISKTFISNSENLIEKIYSKLRFKRFSIPSFSVSLSRAPKKSNNKAALAKLSKEILFIDHQLDNEDFTPKQRKKLQEELKVKQEQYKQLKE